MPHQQVRQLIMREKECHISILSVKAITCTQFEIRLFFKIVRFFESVHHVDQHQDHAGYGDPDKNISLFVTVIVK